MEAETCKMGIYHESETGGIWCNTLATFQMLIEGYYLLNNKYIVYRYQ